MLNMTDARGVVEDAFWDAFRIDTPMSDLPPWPVKYAGVKAEALAYALACIDACAEHDEESLSCQIESHFPNFNLDECDDIAEAAIEGRTHER
jgi:hypothetical protein